MLIAHTLLAAAGLAIAGFAFYTLVRPFAGKSNGELVHSYPMIAFSLLIVSLFGFFAFKESNHKLALFAWVIPSVIALHLLVTRGRPIIMEYRGALPIIEDSYWDVTLTWLASAIAYSIGAVVASRVATQNRPVSPLPSVKPGK